VAELLSGRVVEVPGLEGRSRGELESDFELMIMGRG
jgi:hypothetical protein